MSDQESLNLEDVSGGAEEAPGGEPKRAGFLPSIVLKILKYAAIGLGFIILGATTTVVTFGIINKGKNAGDLAIVSPQYQAKEPPLLYDDSIDEIRGVTADEVQAIFSCKVSLGYDASKNKKLAFEIGARKREIQDIIFKLISTRYQDQLRPEHYAAVQEELKEQINRVLLEGKVQKVVFREFVVVGQ